MSVHFSTCYINTRFSQNHTSYASRLSLDQFHRSLSLSFSAQSQPCPTRSTTSSRRPMPELPRPIHSRPAPSARMVTLSSKPGPARFDLSIFSPIFFGSERFAVLCFEIFPHVYLIILLCFVFLDFAALCMNMIDISFIEIGFYFFVNF